MNELFFRVRELPGGPALPAKDCEMVQSIARGRPKRVRDKQGREYFYLDDVISLFQRVLGAGRIKGKLAMALPDLLRYYEDLREYGRGRSEEGRPGDEPTMGSFFSPEDMLKLLEDGLCDWVYFVPAPDYMRDTIGELAQESPEHVVGRAATPNAPGTLRAIMKEEGEI